MRKLAEMILAANEELAYLEAISMGRPISTYFDAAFAADKFTHMSTLAYSAQGKTSLNTPGFVNMTFRQPFGVCAGIIPWNAPLLFFGFKVSAAVAAGNTFVLKTSEKAPLTCARVAAMVKEAGFPPGVINVIHGHGMPSGQALAEHIDVRCISFTGSARTGRLIQAAAAKSNLKNVILELGGKSPAVVFPDADLDKAVADLSTSVGLMSGQMCIASSRVYVHEEIAEKFIAKYRDMFAVALKTGDPTKPETMRGPQADEIQYKNVLKYIEMGKKSGKMILGDQAPPEYASGHFVPQTIFLETPEDAQIMKEEIFGSVVNINTFKSEEEVLKKANDTEYGLYASVYTKDIDRALRVAQAMQSGMAGVNCTNPTFAEDLPFGGYKSSGLGREGMTESLDHYLETKTVLIRIG